MRNMQLKKVITIVNILLQLCHLRIMECVKLRLPNKINK